MRSGILAILTLFGFDSIQAQTWYAQNSGTGVSLRSLFFLDAATGFAVGDLDSAGQGAILATSDGGATWRQRSSGVNVSQAACDGVFRRIVPRQARHKSSHSRWRSRIVPRTEAEGAGLENHGKDTPPVKAAYGHGSGPEKKSKASASRYIPWHELLRRTFGSEIMCLHCGGPLELIALVKKDDAIHKILSAMHLPTGPPKSATPEPALLAEESLDWGEGGGAFD